MVGTSVSVSVSVSVSESVSVSVSVSPSASVSASVSVSVSVGEVSAGQSGLPRAALVRAVEPAVLVVVGAVPTLLGVVPFGGCGAGQRQDQDHARSLPQRGRAVRPISRWGGRPGDRIGAGPASCPAP